MTGRKHSLKGLPGVIKVNKAEETAERVIKQCMGVKKGEKVLVITDTMTSEVGESLFNAAEKTTQAMLVKIKPTGEHGREPPKIVAKAMLEHDIVLAPTYYSLSRTKARKNATKKGVRIATLPGITMEMFTRAVNVDYKKMEKNIKKVAGLLRKTSKVKIITISGTNFQFENIGERVVDNDTGIYSKKGSFGNLPAGEVFVAPKEKTGAGIIVIDEMEGICKPKTKVLVRKGLVQEVIGDNAFSKKMWKLKNARNIAEFGVGMNPKAILSGRILEEEKVLGTCHIAFGSNFDFGGRVRSEIHWDAILLKPTIWFDDEKIMDSGELIV